jgi:hypothetical protein
VLGALSAIATFVGTVTNTLINDLARTGLMKRGDEPPKTLMRNKPA